MQDRYGRFPVRCAPLAALYPPAATQNYRDFSCLPQSYFWVSILKETDVLNTKLAALFIETYSFGNGRPFYSRVTRPFRPRQPPQPKNGLKKTIHSPGGHDGVSIVHN
jgi:hypothetical protein